MTVEFKHEENHSRHCILFNTSNAKERIRNSIQDIEFIEVKDMEESRLRAIVETAATLGSYSMDTQASAVCVIIPATTNEMMLAQAGFLKLEPHGFSFCPECLQQAIATCEELIISLKDLQEATKVYCK